MTSTEAHANRATLLEPVRCPLCDVDDNRLYARENGFNAVQCRQCGLVYVNPRPTPEAMKALYESSQTHVDLAGHIRQRDYKSVQARKCLSTIQRHRKTGRLLEVGSAAGYFLAEARDAGYQVQGLDVTRPFVAFCNDVLGVPAFEGSLRDAPFADASFDVVYHRNLLSHLHEPVADFQQIHRLLADDGIVVFETGNVAELDADAAGALELPEHLYHFSEATIVALLDKAGFSAVEVARHGLVMQMAPFATLERMVTRPRPRAARQQQPLPDAPPPPHRWARFRASVAQVIRYDLGARLGHRLARATLVVTARKR